MRLANGIILRRKRKKYKHRVPKPIIKKCVKCKVRRVRFHHFLCDKCWKLKNLKVEEKIDSEEF